MYQLELVHFWVTTPHSGQGEKVNGNMLEYRDCLCLDFSFNEDLDTQGSLRIIHSECKGMPLEGNVLFQNHDLSVER